MNTVSQFEPLLEQVRSRRILPPPSERQRIRVDAGVSLRAVGKALGVSHAAVASWERGATPREHRDAYAQLLRELQEASR
jgi:DNA-binding transcriptional regulator YiaG